MRRARAVAVACVLVLSSSTALSGQAPGVKAKPPRLAWPAPAPLGAPVTLRSFGAQPVTEVEPNNSAGTAQLVPLPEEVTGLINPAADVDYFAIDLVAGTAVEMEVFSQRLGSPMDTYMELFAPDGVTSIAASDDAEPPGLDSRIRAVVPTTGRYILGLVDLYGRGGANYNYRLVISRANTGPGDPTTVFASNLGSAWQTAAAPGQLYMVDQQGTVDRIALNGAVTASFLTDVGAPYDVAIDGYGQLLVSGIDNLNKGYVLRVDPVTRARTPFTTFELGSAASVTVGADGDVWVADTRTARLHRFDPTGVHRASINTAGTHGQTVLDMAFSPAGVLYYSNMFDAIYRVVNGTPQRVIQGAGLGGIAFDAQGNLYVGTASRGILLYSPTHELLHEPFAISGLYLTGSLVFVRDAAGAMTSRLLGVNLGDGTMREMNPAGMRAPGFRIGVNLLTVTTDSLKRGVMGAAYADTLRTAEMQSGLTWTLTGGALPPGVTLSPAGVLSGVPEQSGSYTLGLRAEGGGRVGVRTLTMHVARPVVSTAAASNHLLGMPNQLTTELARFMDLQGNNNGRYDIGDLKAYLRGQAAPGRNQREER